MRLMQFSEELNKFLALNETTEGYLLSDNNNEKSILGAGCAARMEESTERL